MSNGCRSSAAASRISTPACRKCEAARGRGERQEKAAEAGKARAERRPGPRRGRDGMGWTWGKAYGASPHALSGEMISPEPPLFRLTALPLRRTGARVRRALPRQPQSVRRVLLAPPAVAGRCFRSAEAAGLRKGRQEFFEKGRRPLRRAVFGAFVSACAFGGGRGAQAALPPPFVLLKNSRGYPGCFLV